VNKPAISLSGVFPPIPTPFDAKGRIATRRLVDNIERWNQYDLSGYVVLGSNGEAGYLSVEEKLRVWKAARQAIPADKVMIAGAGCESTRQTILLTRRAADAGADATLLVTPHYYDGKMTSDSLIRHYQAVADAVPIPVVLYTVPKFTHVDIDAATTARLAGHPNIVGIKDTSGNMAKLANTVRLTRSATPGFQVLAGSAGFFLAGLTLGAVGGILALSSVAPQKCLDLYRLFKAGQLDEAVELQRWMIPVNAAITAHFGIAGLKAALDMLGYYGGPVRSPLLDLTDSEREILRDVLVEGGVL
jgi:4-hydroxy-2-oxoglutarate aldolase